LLLILVLALCSFVEGKRSGKNKNCLKKVRKYQRCLDNGFKSSIGCPHNSTKSMKKYKKKRCAKKENAAKACEELSCEVKAEWGDFGDWSECTAECGGGTKTRNRTCNHSDEEQCLGENSESLECGTLPCPSGAVLCVEDRNNGSSYRGNVAVTESGIVCERWDKKTFGVQLYTEKYPNTGLDDNNYCRNPDGEVGPWCFHVDRLDASWERCDVPRCGEDLAVPGVI